MTALAVALTTIAVTLAVRTSLGRRLPLRRAPIRAPTRGRDTGVASEPSAERGTPTPSRRLLQAVTGLLVLVVALMAPPLVAALLLAVATRRPLIRTVDRRRRIAAIDRALPDTIDLLVLLVRAGATPYRAVAAMVDAAPPPTRPAFVETIRRTRRGASLADALAALGDELGPEAAPVADALALAERYGTPLGPVLDQLSVEVRDQRRRRAEADARRLPVRLSFPLVVCTLPAFVLVAIAPAVIAALSSLGDTGW